MGNCHARFGTGENLEITSKSYLSSSFEMVASAMEAKRLGFTKKSMIVVPKHLTEQFGTEFLQLYPNAKILVATAKDFTAENRKEFCSKIATQDWDAIIMGYTQFEKIPISNERMERMLQEQVDELVEAIDEMKAARCEKFTIKQAELKKSLYLKNLNPFKTIKPMIQSLLSNSVLIGCMLMKHTIIKICSLIRKCKIYQVFRLLTQKRLLICMRSAVISTK